MLVLLLAYLGGILTILSPCILPVLPFVFARSDRPFLTNGLPLLAGMAVTFSLVATLAAFGGDAALAANQWGRGIALTLLAGFALLLIVPSLAERVMRPLVALGNRLSSRADRGGFGASLLLGVATGLLWAPCAGPILGLILTGAALSGASTQTAFLLLAYALGAATSLAGALLVGGRLFAAMKRSIGAGERVRQALGLLILGGVAVIALGLDTKILSRLSSAQTTSIEERLAKALGLQSDMPRSSASLGNEGPVPSIDGATRWFNSPPLTNAQLKGKVVLVDFWTYSCINCIRSVPFVRALDQRYRKDGLIVIGVHTPEFAFERDPDNVRKAIRDFAIRYPVAMDNKWTIWSAFKNRYWPAHYLIDAKGVVRYHHFGEGGDEATEAAVRALLAEAGANPGAARSVADTAGAAKAADFKTIGTRETYLGTRRARYFASPGGLVARTDRAFAFPASFGNGHWAYAGRWIVGEENGTTAAAGSSLAIRFRARDLHLVLGTADGKPIRFTVTIDGKPPGTDHGLDIDAAGRGTITSHRLYQLIRQPGGARDRLFTITFDDPGAQAYAFTFG